MILHIHHPLRVCITKVTLVRRPGVDLIFVQGVLDLVGEDASRKTGDELRCVVGVGGVQDVVVDEDVVSEEGELVQRWIL